MITKKEDVGMNAVDYFSFKFSPASFLKNE